MLISLRIRSKVRMALVFLLLLLFAVALFSCESNMTRDPTPRYKFSEQNEAQREELRKELKTLQKSIDREIRKVKERLVSGQDEQELLLADRKLKSNRSKLDKALYDIENCLEANWGNVKTSTRMVATEVRLSFGQLAFQFEDLLGERQSQPRK